MGVAVGIEPPKVKVGWDHSPDHHLAAKIFLNSLNFVRKLRTQSGFDSLRLYGEYVLLQRIQDK